jgi:hypothetical protein
MKKKSKSRDYIIIAVVLLAITLIGLFPLINSEDGGHAHGVGFFGDIFGNGEDDVCCGTLP